MRWRFDGEIAGLGTTSGTRIVIGRWLSSPYGAFADVMIERSDGQRLLLAPSEEVARFVAATYTFDEVRVAAVTLDVRGPEWDLRADALSLRLRVGSRPVLGLLLRMVPRVIAAAPWWATAVDPVARLLLQGVRTRGGAGQHRREWYGARDLHRVTDVEATWSGVDLGALRPVTPAVRFGFGSTPRRPSVVRVVSTVETRTGR